MVLIAGALYLGGMLRLRKRGDSWPIGRAISWFLGLIVVLWCTNGGISIYANVSVGMHMLQHMTLTMLGPILLVMGAPATLALRALKPSTGPERGPREWLMWFLHSWVTRILTNPFYVFIVYVLGLYGLYLTPAFGWLMGSHVGHIVMQVHFLLSGYLFYWVIIGIDPRPKPLPYWGRLLLLLLSMSVHAFFAVILMMGTTPIAPEWYGIVRPDWITDPLADSLNGGQVAWGIAEIPSVMVLLAIAFQWSRSDDREAKRKDRQADRDGDVELNAYNDRLARLAERDNR
jgi:putative copper resistance protein D